MLRLLIFFCLAVTSLSHGIAQNQEDERTINLGAQGELDLAGLVQWMAKDLNMKIIDDNAELSAQAAKIVFHGEMRLSRDSLFHLVQSILRSYDFAIVESDVPGIHRVVRLGKVRAFAPQGKAGDFKDGRYVTSVFTLQHISTEQAQEFVNKLYGNDQTTNSTLTTIPAGRILIVTEIAARLKKIEALISRIDQPPTRILTEFYKVQNLEANELETQLKSILNSVAPDATDSGKSNIIQTQLHPASSIQINADIRTNRLLLIGTRDQLDSALQLIGQLDIKRDVRLERYQFEFIAASRIDEIVKQSLLGISEDAARRAYQSYVDEQSNQLIVTAREEIHEKIRDLKRELDKTAERNIRNSPMRFYQLKNVKAVDIIDSLNSFDRTIRGNQSQPDGSIRGINAVDNSAPFRNQRQSSYFDNRDYSQDNIIPRNQSNRLQTPDPTIIPPLPDPTLLPGETAIDVNQIIPGKAKISVDENTNTIIIVAEPSVQELYAQLIERLDKRRPQVLIEVNVITIDQGDDFNLGIELSGGDRTGAGRLFAFSSYGLSTVDATTGALSILPGLGFNGTLVDPETADVVLRALARHRRARVLSAPKILVNDNATGLLTSVAEVPFASINANNTVSTTSFAGFAEAGTTINVTPQIAEGEHLNLEFDILVNNFTGTASANLPPPRNTDQVTSTVTIPDGHTIIVGGLTRRRLASEIQGIPFLERIPIINLLGGNQTNAFEEQRLFVFIKPIILRDDRFKDLRYLSEVDRNTACIPDDMPQSGPLLIR
jgi:general secretion pathway protein D